MFFSADCTISAVFWYPMYGTRTVALHRLSSSSFSIFCSFAFSPLMQFFLNVAIAFVRTSIDSKSLNMMRGHITLSSNWLLCAANSIALSFPRTWMHVIITASGIDGLIFPGIIDDPGWIIGNSISEIPAFGPMLINFRLLLKFRRSVESDLSEAEKFMNTFILFVVSVEFFAFSNLIPSSFDRLWIIIFLYIGSVLIPVPTAVPPIPTICKSFACLSIKSFDFLSASLYESSSCPSVIGTASCR